MLQHLAKDATSALCGATITVRNADAFGVTCADCQREHLDRMWGEVNRAKAQGRAGEFVSLREYIATLRRYWDRRLLGGY